ncbi:MAG: hypothetical protein R3B70_41585 [Polyangiaceae bacterium]
MVVLGDMLELGERGRGYHEEVGEWLSGMGDTDVRLFGAEMGAAAARLEQRGEKGAVGRGGIRVSLVADLELPERGGWCRGRGVGGCGWSG